MIPYIHVPDFHLGPLPIHPFGLLVATGVLVGTSITTKRAEKLGYDLFQLNSFVTWMLVSAFLLSHVLDELFYHWDDFVARPWSLLLPWTGLSSFGGFVGAIVGIVLWKYFMIDGNRPIRRARPMPLLPFADLVLSVFPIGWMFGRAGCSTVHDHLGARAAPGTWLAVEHPYGAHDGPITHYWFVEFMHGHDARFDLGLLELMFTVFLAACFAVTWLRRVPVGSYIVASALAYAPVRFAMDYLRVPESEGGDTRYAGLTPAQYGCVALFLFGLFMIRVVLRTRARGDDPAKLLRSHPTEAAAPAA